MITIGIVLLIAVGILGLLLILAEYDVFFTSSAKEGRAMAVLTGDGKFVRWILNMRKTHIEEDGTINRKSDKNGNVKFALFGRPWVGWPWIHSIHRDKMGWEEFDEKKNEVKFRNELTPYLFINKTSYAISIIKAEDRDNFPLDGVVDVFTQPVNAYTARFAVEDWQRVFRALLMKTMNNVIGKFSFTDLKSEIDAGPGSFAQAVMEALKNLPSGASFKKLTGHEVLQIAIRKIDPDESRTEYRDALAAKGLAELKAEGVKAEAVGRAEAIKTIANANAHAITVEKGAAYAIKTKDDRAVKVAIGEAIENYKGNTLVLGEKVVPAINTEGGTNE